MVDLNKIFKQIGDAIKGKTKGKKQAGADGVQAAAQAGATATGKGVKPGDKPVAGQADAQRGRAKPGVKGGPAKPGAKPGAGKLPKPFDIKIYVEAVKTGSSNFFKEQIPYFFKNFKPVMKKAMPWYKGLPKDEKVAYGVWIGGHFLMLAGIILIIVL